MPNETPKNFDTDNDPTTAHIEEPGETEGDTDLNTRGDDQTPEQDLPDESHTTTEPDTALSDRIRNYNTPKRPDHTLTMGSLEGMGEKHPEWANADDTVLISARLAASMDNLLNAVSEWEDIPNDVRSAADNVRRLHNFQSFGLNGEPRPELRRNMGGYAR